MGILSGFNEKYKETKVVESVPMGSYECAVQEVTIDNEKELCVIIYFEVMQGEYAGKTIQKRYYLNSHEITLSILKSDLQKLDFLHENLDALEDRSDELMGRLCKITKKESDKLNSEGKPYINIIISRVKGMSPKPPVKRDSLDDIPF